MAGVAIATDTGGMSFVKLTDHAKERALSRFWLSDEKLIEMAEKSVMEGYSIGDAPNDEIKRYLRRKAKGKKAYVYSGYVFIFTEDLLLITTYRMPRHYLLTLERENTYIGNGDT